MTGPRPTRGSSVILPFVVITAVWGSTWIVIRGQLSSVPPQWSVSYRFVIASLAMAFVARLKGETLRLDRKGAGAAAFLGFCQFCVNFNGVYLAERHITSGVVATVFALLLIPSSLLAWLFLGQRPTKRFAWSSLVAVAGIMLLFVNEMHVHQANRAQVISGIALTFAGMLGASVANVAQARPEVRRHPLFSMLAWSMGAGAVIDGLIAFAMTGPPVMELRVGYWLGLFYLALIGTVLTFSLYYPLVRIIGPAKASYSSVLVPIIAMGFSTSLEHYHWSVMAIAGALLAVGGMAAALRRDRPAIAIVDTG